MSYDTKEQALKWGANRGPAHTLYEKPAIYGMLPHVLTGARVLSVGCGFGEECQFIAQRGAEVVGTDYSEEMISIASSKFPQLTFVKVPMEELANTFEPASFDIVFSSLALHYAEDLRDPLAQFAGVLKDSGEVILSTHHPVYWGGERATTAKEKLGLLGYRRDFENGRTEHFGDYLTDRKIVTQFRDAFDVSFFHNSLSTMHRAVRSAGFYVDELVEPRPLEKCREEFPEFFETASRVPLFILLRLRKLNLP